jgi:hypothetical protein
VPVGPRRHVTLVLCTSTGDLLGALPAFDVISPYWQEVDEVVARAHAVHGVDVTVLRILHTEATDPPDGGAVAYLAQIDEPPPVPLRAWPGDPLRDHPLRLDYARPARTQTHLRWAQTMVHDRGEVLTGRPLQIRTWNLSSIWRLPTSAGTVWLKVMPPFLAREGAVLPRLPDTAVPRVLAAQRNCLLLADVPGRDQYEAAGSDLLTMVDLLFTVQREWVSRTDELLALGAADRRRESVCGRVFAVVERYHRRLAAEERHRIDDLVETLDRRFAALEQCGVPDTLVHGDFHPGNVRGSAPDFVILDWGEVGVGHPGLDLLTFCGRLGGADRNAVQTHWALRWQDFMPGVDPARAATLLQPVSSLIGAVVYQDFLDNIEPDERCYHRHDPLRSLRAATRW